MSSLKDIQEKHGITEDELEPESTIIGNTAFPRATNIIEEDDTHLISFEDLFDDEPTVEIKCTCGAEKTYGIGTSHSDWCDLERKN